MGQARFVTWLPVESERSTAHIPLSSLQVFNEANSCLAVRGLLMVNSFVYSGTVYLIDSMNEGNILCDSQNQQLKGMDIHKMLGQIGSFL